MVIRPCRSTPTQNDAFTVSPRHAEHCANTFLPARHTGLPNWVPSVTSGSLTQTARTSATARCAVGECIGSTSANVGRRVGPGTTGVGSGAPRCFTLCS